MKFEKLVIKLLLYMLNCIVFDNCATGTFKEHVEIGKECKEFIDS